MTYAKGSGITAADYNTFVGPINVTAPYASAAAATGKVAALYGVGYGDRGYGQAAPNLSKKTVGNPNELLWLCTPSGDNNADGGWDTQHFAVDSTKKYRSTVWFWRSISDVNNGMFYHGLSGAGNTYNLVAYGGANNTNPYWHYPKSNELPVGQWYLSVGILHEAGYTGGDSGLSGIYDIHGNKVYASADFRMAPGTTAQQQRVYHYYDTTTVERQYMARPRWELINGSEPSIATLVSAPWESVSADTMVKPSQWVNGTFGSQGSMFVSSQSTGTESSIKKANSPGVIGGPTGSIVRAQDFIDMRNALATMANHQGTAQALNPPASEFVVGGSIKAEVPATTAYDFQTLINNVDANRLSASAGNMTLVANAISSVRNNPWGSPAGQAIGADFTATFSSEDKARFFFNSGGTLNLVMSHANTTTTQNSNWNTILSALGTISMGARNTTRSGSGGAPAALGYYNLTTTAQTIFSGNIGTGAYTANSVSITAWVVNVAGVNGGNGTVVRIKVILTDGHTNAFSDTVATGTTATMGYRKSATYLTGIETPTFAVPIQFG